MCDIVFKKFTFAVSTPDEFLYNEKKPKPVFVFIIFAALLGEIGKVDNVAYNSTFAYSVYDTFDRNRPSH